MRKHIVRKVVRTRLKLQSLEKGCLTLNRWGEKYLELGKSLTEEQAGQTVRVPESLGVDSDMTGWSYYQLLEHNAIVNEVMSLNVKMLMTGQGKKVIESFNPKTDVLPSEDAGSEQMKHFQDSIDDHLMTMKGFDDLKSDGTNTHPLFGEFDAHMWHGMIGLHLKVHYKQAKMIVDKCQGI